MIEEPFMEFVYEHTGIKIPFSFVYRYEKLMVQILSYNRIKHNKKKYRRQKRKEKALLQLNNGYIFK